MDFTIFDTGDPKSPGSGEPKSTDAAPEKAAGADTAAPAQRAIAAHGPGDRKRSDPPTRPGFYDPSRPRFPRGYLLTVCTLIIETDDAKSSRILANLFRALYQDETAFNFSALNQLGAINREHAENLIAAKLAGAYTPVEWERSFRLIEEYADPYLPAAAANSKASEETDHLDDALADMRGQHLAPPPAEAPPKPLPQSQRERQSEIQIEKSAPRQNIERERVPPRPHLEKPVAAPAAPVITPAAKPEPQRAQPPPAPAERPRAIQQARLTEPTRPPEHARPIEPSRQQAPRGSRPAIQRAAPRQPFVRTDPPLGFVRTEPPPQSGARQDRDVRGERGNGNHRDHAGPVNFIVPPDSFQPPGSADSGAVRREPIINLDVPLESNRESDRAPERGGHDKLMYGLLALIIIAALAFVAINYSLFYKGGIPGLGKSAEVSRIPGRSAEVARLSGGSAQVARLSGVSAEDSRLADVSAEDSRLADGSAEDSRLPGGSAEVSRLPGSEARKVSTSAAALKEPVDLMPVSRKTAIAPPRWMAFSGPRQTEPEQEPSGPSGTPSEADSLAARASLPARPLALQPSAAVKKSPARASATRAAAARKLALNNPSASRTTAIAEAAPRDPAYLTFAISPWGEVYVDGRRHGASPPLRRLEIEPGRHTVEIRNGDLTPYRTVVELEPQATVNIRQQFR